MDKNFNNLAARLEKKIYGSEKGKIRFQLIKDDITEYYPEFNFKKLEILDAGGGMGHFSRFCASKGHSILLCDISEEMLSYARCENLKKGFDGQIDIIKKNLNDIKKDDYLPFDMISLHGVAEWMDSPEDAIRHCCSILKPGGKLSLLVYNKNKYLLKRGINGRLLKKDKPKKKNRKLTPTGKMAPDEIRKLLSEFEGEVILQSGIRIFNHFLKIIEPRQISGGEWLDQERLYYRKEPFASLGEHTHILWSKNN